MLVSIIIPLYRGEKYIPGLVRMIIDNARHAETECIFVNDSPKDGIITCDRVLEIYDEEMKKAGKLTDKELETLKKVTFTVINNDVNMGIHASRIAGLRCARGEYILFLDQDDAVTQRAVNTLVNKAIKTGADLVVANGYRSYPDKKVLLYEKKAAMKLVSCENVYIYGTDMIFSPGQCLIKKASIPLAWYDNILSVNGCDDFYLWLLMLDKGIKIAVTGKRLYCHRETAENYSNSYASMEASFKEVCKLLASQGYSKKKVSVLKRRYELKSTLKSGKNNLEKIVSILCNIDVMCYTLLYKLCGYH